MTKDTIELKAKVYVYDLNNCAQENGFKNDETWEFSMVNDEDKNRLERKYFPTITAKVLPEILSELVHLVKSKLKQATGKQENNSYYDKNEMLQYVVAYIPGRLRN